MQSNLSIIFAIKQSNLYEMEEVGYLGKSG